MTGKVSKFAFIYWFLAAFFYLYQYVLRVSAGVVTDNLMQEFEITASSIGTVMGILSISYVVLQIPAGTLTDYLGVKYLLPITMCLCAFGAYLFGETQNYYVLLLSRALIGAASAFSFIGATKVISLYFPEKRMPFMVSFTILIGTIGGVLGVGPLSRAIEDFGWRVSVKGIAFVGLILAAITFLMGIKKAQPQNKHTKNVKGVSLLAGVKAALATPQILIVCAWGFCIYMPLCVFADAWGVPYLMKALGISKSVAADKISMIYIGVLFGCPFYGWVATKFGNYRLIFMGATFTLLVLFSFVLWQVQAISEHIHVVLFVIGFAISVQLLMFPAAVRHTKREYTGSVVGFVNTFTMASGAVFQKLVGVVLDWLWDGSMCEGVPDYALPCYQKPLSIIIVMMFLGTIAAYFVKEPAEAVKGTPVSFK